MFQGAYFSVSKVNIGLFICYADTHVTKRLCAIVVAGSEGAGLLWRGLEGGIGNECRSVPNGSRAWSWQATGWSHGRAPSASTTIDKNNFFLLEIYDTYKYNRKTIVIITTLKF